MDVASSRLSTGTLTSMKTYGKSLLSFLGLLALVVIPYFSGNRHPDASEWVAIAIGATQLVGVWLIPLAPQAKWSKTAVSLVLTLLQVLTVVIIGGIDGNDVGILITAVLTFFGVAVTGAISPTPHGVPDVVAKSGIGDS